MGYNDHGHCPMWTGTRCSIYEHRPRTCRTYDCRVFTATGLAVDQQTQYEIANRVKAWAFHYESEAGPSQRSALQKAAAFLQNNRDLFPHGALPAQPAHLAALAVRIYKLFAESTAKAKSDAALAGAILTKLNRRRPQRPTQP